MGNSLIKFKSQTQMKFIVTLALIGLASTAEAETDAATCKVVGDCEKNFDAIYAKWEEEGGDEDAEPKKGELSCAKMSVANEDPKAESFETKTCVPNKACGITVEKDGTKVTFDCSSEGAKNLLAGLAALTVIA